MDPFIGEIRMFAGTFAPRGYAFCDGQLLAISQNTALFSLLGTTFGGDGQTTFGLPDLRGRSPVHPGDGPGLPYVVQGQRSGNDTGWPVLGDVTLARDLPTTKSFDDAAGSQGTAPQTFVHFIIAIQGILPSRN